MNEFRFLSYYTVYSCEGSLNYNYLNSPQACFSKIFNSDIDHNSKIKYEILLNYDLNKTSNKHISNYCPFSIKEIKNHLLQVKNIYNFKFKIFNIENKKYYKIEFYLNNVPKTFHKYLLTWVRYLYEFPFNMFLKDAYLLKNEKQFTFTSILNLYNLISSSFDFYRDLHQITESGQIHKFMFKKEIVNRLLNTKYLHNIFKMVKVNPELINTSDVYNLEFWLNNDCFEKRKTIYLNNYKLILK